MSTKVSNLLGKSDDRPKLESVKPGPHERSNAAIGVDVDVQSKRVGALGLIDLPGFQKYANDLYAQLKAASGVTGVPGEVYVLASTALEAGSTPDGNVFISVGWINSIESEDELVALLGHELGHVLLKHHDTSMFSTLGKKAKALFARSVEYGNQMLKYVPELEVKGVSASETASVLKRSQIMIEVTDGAALPAWGRVQEREADKVAMDLVVKRGYSARQGVLVFLEHIRAWEEQLAAMRSKMQDELQQSIVETGESGKLDAAQKKAVDGMLAYARDQLAVSHDDAATRIEDITKYREQFYADAPRKPLNSTAYRAIMDASGTRPILAAYQQVFISVEAIEGKRYTEAIDILTKVTRTGGPIAQDAAPNYYLYLAMVGSNQEAKAVEALNRSFSAREPSWKPYEAKAKYYIRQHNPDKAAETVDAAIARFKNAPPLQPEIVGIYSEFGWKDKAKATLQECEINFASFGDACKAHFR